MSTILIVEDEENNMKFATDILTMHGYKVLQAWNGKEALVVAKEKQPHIILMDMQMPEMDGIQATNLLKTDNTTSHMKIIILTANAMRGDQEMVLAAGADYYLAKPYQYNDLLQIILKCQNELSAEG